MGGEVATVGAWWVAGIWTARMVRLKGIEMWWNLRWVVLVLLSSVCRISAVLKCSVK